MTKPKNLFYVDDDEDDRELLIELFKGFKEWSLETFENGYDLLESLGKITSHDFPCLIVIDINMPKLNGIELLSLLKNNSMYSKIPVVLFSTGATPYNKVKVQELKTEVITKPINISRYKEVRESLISYCG